MKLNKMREQMAKSFLAALREDTIPWRREWTQFRPQNAVTDKAYRGINNIWLSYAAERKGYKDPRWCTFKQAKDKGWSVKKGERGTPIEFWSLYDLKEKRKLTNAEAEKLWLGMTPDDFHERVKPISSVYSVFNAEQIEGIPEIKMERYHLNESRIEDIRDRLVRNMEVGFKTGGEEAFYRPREDCIHMPAVERFKSEYGYFSVFLHEAGHATGHKSRLDRKKGNEFGSPEYAREELRAEIASAFTSQALTLPEGDERHMDNHKAYIQSWIETLEKDPGELFAAIKDAEKISDYLIEKGELMPEIERMKVHEKNKAASRQKNFSEQLDELIKGESDRYNDLKVCDTPQILLKAGCEQLPMLYTKRHLRKALLPKDEKKHTHGLEIEQMRRLPEYIREPAMLIDSMTRKDSMIAVFPDWDSKKNPLVATIRPNGTGIYELELMDSNFITSVYGRNHFENFLNRSIENDRLLFWDRKKSQELFSVLGLQFPKGLNNLDSDTIIHKSGNIVKGNQRGDLDTRDLGRFVDYTQVKQTPVKGKELAYGR